MFPNDDIQSKLQHIHYNQPLSCIHCTLTSSLTHKVPSHVSDANVCGKIPYHRVIFLTLHIKHCTKCNIKVSKYYILDLFARARKKN